MGKIMIKVSFPDDYSGTFGDAINFCMDIAANYSGNSVGFNFGTASVALAVDKGCNGPRVFVVDKHGQLPLNFYSDETFFDECATRFKLSPEFRAEFIRYFYDKFR